MAIRKHGTQLRTLDDWYSLAPPKSPSHWIDGRSAKEAAIAWLGSGGDSMPQEVEAILASHPDFGTPQQWEAEPEAKLAFDEFRGEPRNSDLVVHVVDQKGPYVLGVEAKADEAFGETVADALANALERRVQNRASKGLARLEELATKLMPARTAGQPSLGQLRYQLLTACAGVLAEASRKQCHRAVMLVQEFVTEKTLDDHHARNAADLAAFLQRLTGADKSDLTPGRLYGPCRTPGWPVIELYVGKAARVLRPPVARTLPTYGLVLTLFFGSCSCQSLL